MTSVRISPVLTGAALALILAAPGFAQQQTTGQQSADQQNQIPVEVTTPETTAEAARNAGAAGQVVQQLEEAQQALELGDAEAAREALGQAKEMLQKARVVGSPERLLQIEAHLEGATGALEAGDLARAEAAIGAAAQGMIEIERASSEQGLEPSGGQQATGQVGQQQGTLTTGQSGQQQATQAAGQSVQQATGQSGQATGEVGHQQATVLGQQNQQTAVDSGLSSQDALREAREALESARQQVDSALRAVEDALQQGGGSMAAAGAGGGMDRAAQGGSPEAADRQASDGAGQAGGDAVRVTVVGQGETGAAGAAGDGQASAPAGGAQGMAAGQEAGAAGDQQAAGEDDAQITVVEESETEALPATSDEQQQVPQPQPQLSAEDSSRLLGTGDREIGQATETLTMTIGDLSGRDVLTFDGERVGEIGQVVTNGENVYAIVEHGGFLGIGEDKVAIPANRLGLRGEEIVLLGLSQEQLERIPEYDFETGQELGQEQSIEIGRYN